MTTPTTEELAEMSEIEFTQYLADKAFENGYRSGYLNGYADGMNELMAKLYPKTDNTNGTNG